MNFLRYIREFGFRIFVIKSIRKFFWRFDGCFAKKINRINEYVISSYLSQNVKVDNSDEYRPFFQRKKGDTFSVNPIWVMWWQGEENMPNVVNLCVKSIKRNAGDHPVIIINKDNYLEYISLPDYVIKKVDDGKISLTHLSDLIRMTLLYCYGGAWIDATVFVTKQIPERLFAQDFWSIKTGLATKDPSHGRWTTFLLFGREGNQLFRDVLEKHFEYWKKHTMPVDYVMFDYIIAECVNANVLYKMHLENIPISNIKVFELQEKLNQLGDLPDDKDTVFYKLSYKHALEENIEGEKTIWGKLLERYEI